MLANSVQGTAVNQDLDQEIDYLQVIVRLARDLRYISIRTIRGGCEENR